MPTTQYKEARTCECGFTTIGISNWAQHRKRCSLIPNDKDKLIEQMKQQLADTKEQLAYTKEQLAYTKEQLAAKDELLDEQREDLRMFEKLLAERFAELNDEVKQHRKRKKTTKTTRINRTEPERRKIAGRQNWKCAGDACKLAGKLEAYDVDHIIPLWKGGKDDDDNVQALCPACHRIKTDMERIERAMLAEPVA